MKQFEKDCQALDARLDYGVTFFDAKGEKPDVCEDDGNLHITRHGVRAVFTVNVGQDESGKRQNEKTREILKALDITLTNKQLLRAQVKEDDGDESDELECPHCGRTGCEDW